jgi:hypothetical protein
MFKNRYKYIRTTLNHEARDVINKLKWYQTLNSFKKYESKTEAKDKNSKDDERVGRLQDKDCCVLTENLLRINQQHHKVRLNAYHQSQAG